MTSKVEEVGDAFLDALGCWRDEKTVIIERRISRRQFDTAIRKAILAMREPTKSMIESGRESLLRYETYSLAYQAMIDAALV